MKTFITKLLSKSNFKKIGIATLLLTSIGFTQHAFAQAPANDNCTGAIAFPTIPTDQTCAGVVVNTNGATESMYSGLGDADDDVWYTFVCPAGYTELRYAFASTSGAWDIVIEFFSDDCSNLSSIAAFDEESGTISGLTPGNTYHVRIYTYFTSTTTNGTLCLKVPPPPPVNDECAGAIAFPSIPTDQSCVSVIANTDEATQSLADNCYGTADDDVWYSFVCPSGYTSLRYDMSYISGGSDRVIEFYSGSCGNLVSMGCNNAPNGSIPDLTPGQTYYFRVFSYFYPDFTETSICLHVPPPPPVNDECTTAIAFPPIPTDLTCASVEVNTDAATQSMPGCNGTADDDVWYSFVCPAGEDRIRYEISDIDGSSDKIIEFFSGDCNNFTSLGCSSDDQGVISGLTGNSTYYFRIYSFDPNDYTHASICLKKLPPPPANDEATGAIALVVDAGCAGLPYTNAGGTQSNGEPYPNITAQPGYGTTWFKFTAPASGMVKITDDYSSTAANAAGDDSRMVLFSATDPADYSTFTAIAGDDDNGIVINQRSAIFTTGLTAGATYYIAYDGADASTAQGTFCLTVDELKPTMLSSYGACEGGASNYAQSSFAGWRSLTDPSGRLIAIVKQDGGSGMQPSVTINAAGMRVSSGGTPYLRENYNFICYANNNPAVLQLFLKDADLDDFNAAVTTAGGSPVTLSDLRVISQQQFCSSNYNESNNPGSVVSPTAFGAANGVSFVQISNQTISSYTNYFLTPQNNPLPLKLINFNGRNNGATNTLSWQTAEEKNFSHFELQRSSNGSDFSKLDIIQGKNIGTGSKYQYDDVNPLKGENFYRLLMIDANGTTDISNVIELTSKGGSGMDIVVHPNPVKAMMQINISGAWSSNASILVMDVTGKVLQTIQPTSNNVSVDLNGMPAGTYIVKYIDDSHTTVTKVVKE